MECKANRLLGLLGGTLLTSIAVDVSQVGSLLNATLDRGPDLTNRRGKILAVGNGITTSSQLIDGLLDKGALCEASPHEDSVDGNENPRALGEEDSGEKKTEPKSNLKDSNKGHGAVVVVLDKVTNGIGKSRSLLLLAGRGLWLRLEGWQQVGASVGCYVEYGVNGERQNGKWDLTGEEPDKSHC